jgi:hypothetical protein
MGKKGSKSLEEVKIEREPAGRWRVEEEFVGATRGTEEIRFTDFPTGVPGDGHMGGFRTWGVLVQPPTLNF